MERILASIFIGLCIFLGNISSQAKSYKIVEHISSEHSIEKKAHSQHHHHGHHKHQHHKNSEKKTSKSHDHQHSAELSLVTIYLALPSYTGFISEAPISISTLTGFYSLEDLNKLSFSPPVFRPPIV